MEQEEIYKILEQTYFSENSKEKKILEKLPRLFHSEMVFIDIGANIGQYTFQAKQNMNRCSIYAIEPDPIRFSKLKENCQKWEYKSDNTIYPLQIAMSDQDSNTSFYITNSPVSGSFFKYDISHLNDELRKVVVWEEITVASYKLDTLFKKIDPDLVKINAGGSELQILKGSTSILKQGKAKFLIEVNKWQDPEVKNSSADICDFMKSFDYYPKDFYGRKLFVNQKKSLLHTSKRIYRQILPVAFRQQVKSWQSKFSQLLLP